MARRKKIEGAPETVTRAFDLPISIVEPREAWETVHECWEEAGALARWVTQQLLMREAGVSLARGRPFPPMPSISPAEIYTLAMGRSTARKARSDSDTPDLIRPAVEGQYPRREWWRGAAQSAGSVIDEAYKKYRDERFDVLCRGTKQWSSFSPRQPYPIPGQLWLAARFNKDGYPVVEVRLPHDEHCLPYRGYNRAGGLGPVTYSVGIRLRVPKGCGRQLALFRRLVGLCDHEDEDMPLWRAARTELTLLPGDSRRDDKVKMVVQFLKGPVRTGGQVLLLLTDPEAFWVGELITGPGETRKDWVLNNDHFRGRLIAHQRHLRRLQRLSEDAKAERRAGGNRAHAQMPALEAMCRNDRQRLDSWTREAASHLVNYCRRQGVTDVIYLDRDRRYLPRFPWHQLLLHLKQRCERPDPEDYTGSVPPINLWAESEVKREGYDVPPGPPADCPAGDETDQEKSKWRRVGEIVERTHLRLLLATARRGSHPAVS